MLYIVFMLIIAKPIIISEISKRVKGEIGKTMGAINSLTSASYVIAPIIGGYVINNYEPGAIGLLASMATLASLLLSKTCQ